ncbi:MAG TPA: DNA/RNA non-specific endonuclease [Jatrophihabitans sp.]|nr:DNA/RNA non-specific endonuclease [Jatrophihabitans sp.]
MTRSNQPAPTPTRTTGLLHRPGYRSNFLGASHKVELPGFTPQLQADLATATGGGPELKYWTYSAFVSTSRRLPVLSAANFQRGTAAGVSRATAVWQSDPRLAKPRASSRQVINSWYKHQPPHLGHRLFDRGHLTAFENAAWGRQAERNGLDTFFFTNCAPQDPAFNEHAVWRQIETWVATQGDTNKILIFNGPVFDAPPSTPAADGYYQLNPFQPPAADPVLLGVSIPKQYFKVAVYLAGGKLAVQSFVVTQEAYLAQDHLSFAGAPPNKRELALYRVPLAVVGHLTGLDFGALAGAAGSVNALRPAAFQLIKHPDDL